MQKRPAGGGRAVALRVRCRATLLERLYVLIFGRDALALLDDWFMRDGGTWHQGGLKEQGADGGGVSRPSNPPIPGW